MIEIIGDPETSVSVTVSTYGELKDVLEDDIGEYKNITNVSFDDNIIMTNDGITIPVTKPHVIIDGIGQSEGEVFSYTTTADSAEYTMKFADPGSERPVRSLTMQNIKITCNNRDGIFYSIDNRGENTTCTFKDMTFDGKIVAHNAFGTVEIYDSEIKVARSNSNYSVAECSHIVFGGNINVFHSPSGGSTAFQLSTLHGNTEGSVLFKENASAVFNLKDTFAFPIIGTPLTVEQGAKAVISAGVRMGQLPFGDVLVEDNAVLDITCEGTGSSSVALMQINGSITVNNGAVMSLRQNGANRILQFMDDSKGLYLNNPKNFLLYCSNPNAVGFSDPVRLELYAEQINLWNTQASDGGVIDIPSFSWRKIRDHAAPPVTAYIKGDATDTAFTPDGDGTNLTDEELTDKPLSSLHLSSAYAFSAGSLNLNVNPITDKLSLITGSAIPQTNILVDYIVDETEVELSGVAGADGKFSFSLTEPLPVGTDVSVKANSPYLLSGYDLKSLEDGELTITEPDELPFIFEVVGGGGDKPRIYGRRLADWKISVTDSRVVKSTWYLYASALGSLKSTKNESHTLPDSLVYVNEEGLVQSVENGLVLVYTGGGTATTDIIWAQNRGLLMRECVKPIYFDESYAAQIEWTLSEAPLSENDMENNNILPVG